MGAPSDIIWGEKVTSGNTLEGKIGIYVTTSTTNTVVKTTVQIWFATRYSCYDKTITLKFNSGEDVSSAHDTVVTSKPIKHTDDTGNGWGSKNQTLLYEYTTSTGWSRTHSNRTIKFYASLTGIDMLSGLKMTDYKSITVKAKPSYKITFNANGGSGAPSSQTKWYGESLTLSSTKPTKTGYTFKGWSTSSSPTSATWSDGGTYTRNESNTLYAVWQANTYTIKYNANGGSGAPSNQTKTHNKTLILSSTKPKRTNYNFEGWSTSSTATSAEYLAGGSYTDNKAATLYAVWTLAYTKPRITNFSVRRVNQNGQNDDQGKICKVIFNWATDKAVQNITVSYRQATANANWSDIELTASGTSGSVSQNLSPEFKIDNSYEIKVTVSDVSGSSYATRTLPSAKFLIDFKSGGDGIAIGKAAENAGFDVYMDTKFEKSVTTLGDFRVTGATTLDGNLTGKYITGTWLQTTAATDLNNTPPKVAVLDNSGWIYSRTPNELKSDMGLSKIFISQTISPKEWSMPANSSRGGEIKGTIKGYEGYTPILTSCYCINSYYIAIINAWLSGSYSSNSNGYTWHIDARNFASSNITADFTINILWIKSNLFG